MTIHGPNVARLTAFKFALLLVPAGDERAAALAIPCNPTLRDHVFRAAEAWAKSSIEAAKCIQGSVYGSDDEAIAGEILRRMRTPEAEQRITTNKESVPHEGDARFKFQM